MLDREENTSLSKCQTERKRSTSSRKKYVFVARCKSNGEYNPLQCWAFVGLCWCVNKIGVELFGTRTYFPNKPNCKQIGNELFCTIL